jgi:basic membrane protein A
VCAVGRRLTEAVHIAAEERPNQKFALIAGESTADNMMGSLFDTEEGAFLAGVTAALVASPLNIADLESNNTGYIALMGSRSDDDTVQEMMHGFIQGVKYANDTYLTVSTRKVHIINEDSPVFLGSYNNSQGAYEQALDWYLNDDVSLIFAPVRASIVGIRQAMFEANETLGDPIIMPNNETRRPLAIGAEGNQDYYGNPDYEILSGPTWITTSVVLRTDLAIYDIVNRTLWGDFNGGVNLEYNYYNNGCNITDFEFSNTYIYPIYMDWISETIDLVNFNNNSIIITDWEP